MLNNNPWVHYKEYIDASIPNNGELEIQNWKTYFDDDKTEYVIINAYYDKEDSFLLDKIEKTKEGYIARIIEYEEDYGSENSIIITNTNEEEIGRVSNNDNETKIQEIVKQNMDRFTKKEINLEKQEERLIVKSVKIVKD